MPTFIASYDLKETNPDAHSKFLAQSRNHGWNYWILSSENVWYRLPNTTLDGRFETMTAAETALEATRAATQAEIGLPVTMEKWAIAQYIASRFNSDARRQK